MALYAVSVAKSNSRFPVRWECSSARLDGKIQALKPLLDQLISEGFRLDPRVVVSREALARVGEQF